MIRTLLSLLLVAHTGFCQEAGPLTEKLKTLTSNYEAAVSRATAPLTKSYIAELERLKLEYTRAGNLQAALAADGLLKGASSAAGAVPKTGAGAVAGGNMAVEEFKAWLSTVVIRELSDFRNRFTYDGRQFFSTKEGGTPRVHENVMITTGKIFVPFTSTNATIVIDKSRATAEVTYSTGQKVEAKIEPKTKN
ncbi:MAG: hypothetical protein ABMA13_10845 [Chthoniobacteraceae bacterium]